MSETITVPMAKQRDIQMVTTEIRTLTQQGQRLILEYAIEIGRRLHEAKSMLPHGEWGSWLREEVEFSQSTANNFMRMFEEYGADQISIFGAEAKSQTIGNLPYTKALKLLALPEEEREEFIKMEDVAHMSSRELERAIKERDAARKRAQDAEASMESMRQGMQASKNLEGELRERLREVQEAAKETEDEAQKSEHSMKLRIEEAENELSEAQEELAAVQSRLKTMQENAEVPQEKLDELSKSAAAEAKKQFEAQKKKLIEAAKKSEGKAREAEKHVEALRKQLLLSNTETAQFRLLFGQVQESFATMLGLLETIGQTDMETADKLRGAIKALAEKILMESNG